MEPKDLLNVFATVMGRQVGSTDIQGVQIIYSGVHNAPATKTGDGDKTDPLASTGEPYVSIVFKKAGFAPQAYRLRASALEPVRL